MMFGSQPGGLGTTSGGQKEFVAPLARAAMAVGCDGIFMETHDRPDRAISDGPNQIPVAQLRSVLDNVLSHSKEQK